MSNLELQIQKISENLKGCLSTDTETISASIKECLDGFSALISGPNAILEFQELSTLETKFHNTRSIKECQLLTAKKLLAFIEVLKSLLVPSHSPKVKNTAIKALVELSRLHVGATPNAQKANLLSIFEEKILEELFANLVEGNDEESVQIFAKLGNKHADLAILAFHYYAEIIQNNKTFENMPEKKIRALWILIRSLDDDFTFALEKSYFGKGVASAQGKGINNKRRNPYMEETKDEETSQAEELAKLYKKTFQRLSQIYLKISGLTNQQIEDYLKIFNKKIIPRLENPLLFADYLMYHFEKGNNADIQILALSNIFIMIIKHALELPNYYNKLYSILSKHLATPNDSFLFQSKYKHKFLKLLDNSLKSSKLPVHLIASYIKILARVALRTEASDTLWICSLLYNLVKKNDALVNMIKAESFKTKTQDTFLPFETDVSKTNAIDNALWELKSLQNHYCKEVRDLVNLFPNIEKNDFLQTDDFMDIKLDNLIVANLEKAKKQPYVKFAYLGEAGDDEHNFKLLDGTALSKFLKQN